MPSSPKRLLAFAFAAIALSTHAMLPRDFAPGTRVDPREQTRPTTEGLAKAGALRGHHVHAVRLAPPGVAKAAQVGRASKGAPLKIGFARDLPDLATQSATAAALEWERLADGSQVADLSVDSAGAAALRVAIVVDALPDAAVLRFQAAGDAKLFETTGREVNSAIARDIAAGESGDAARTWWSPVIEGETIALEIELPPGTDPSAVRVAMPLVSHLVTSAGTAFATPTAIGGSDFCEVNATCSTTWTNQENSVAEMVFSDGTGTFLCTGTLLADQDPGSNVPYFLSANHCVNTQAAASSLVTYWFYRAATCAATTTPGNYQQLTGGAALLYHTTATDTSFMRLNNTPPQGTFYSGWFVSSTPAAGTGVTGLHQPHGDLLKISQGGIDGYLTCSAPDSSGNFSCNSSSAGGSTFYDVSWSSGTTEPGSSGSGIFLDGGYLVGQLFGGSGSCSSPGSDAYGRFDVAYNNALKSWLSPPVALTVTKSGSGAGTVSSSPAGISCGATCTASFASGSSVTLTAVPSAGSTFSGWSGACSGTGSCTVSVSAASSVTATFTAFVPLTVSTAGAGTVTSSPAGISCAPTCSASFASGSTVALSAAPASGLVLKSWGGACSGSGSCVVSMNGAQSVSASFGTPDPADLAISQTASPSPGAIGEDLVFAISVANNGPGGATGVTVTDTIPAGASFVSAWPNCTNSGGTVTCNLGSIASHGTGSAVVVVRPGTSGTSTNAASVSANEPDPSSADNASTLATPVAATPAATLANLSTRGAVLSGANVMIGGFVISGASPKTVVVRAIGPSLASFGISGTLADPTLQLVRMSDNTTIATNDNWGSAANAAQVSSSGFAPSDPRESAILMTLAPGAYTAMVSGAGGTTGVGMVEVYEVDHPEVPLINISTRGEVIGGSGVMIGGFVVSGTGPRTVVVRALGPSLAQFGITGTLANPTLQLVRASDQSVVATNDDWGTAWNAPEISANGLAPSDARESAIMATLTPGAYTAIVSGVGGSTGVGIVEVYAK